MVGKTLGHYRILRPIGAGGMGEVFLAEDTRLGSPVALKILRGALTSDEERVRRFDREARAASALNHPKFVTIHDVGTAEGTHYIAMEFVEGRTLRQLRAERQLELGEALDIAVQVAAALSAAHSSHPDPRKGTHGGRRRPDPESSPGMRPLIPPVHSSELTQNPEGVT